MFCTKGYLTYFHGDSGEQIGFEMLITRADLKKAFQIMCESNLMMILNNYVILPVMCCKAESNSLNYQ